MWMLRRQFLCFHHRSSTVSLSRFSSSVDPVSDAESIREATIKSGATKHSPSANVLFPWRHEGLDDPLPRLVQGTEEFYKDIMLTDRGQGVAAWAYLNKSWVHTLLLPNSDLWGKDLKESTCRAFALAVAGIASHFYGVPFDTVSQNEDKLEFDYNNPPPIITNTNLPTDSDAGNFDELKETEQEDEDQEKEDDDELENSNNHLYSLEVENMLSSSLRDLYEAAAESGKGQLRIRLHVQPTAAVINNLFCFPFLTRQVAQEATTKAKVKKMVEAMRQSPYEGWKLIMGNVEDQMNRHGKLETTLDLQVLVICREVFQVFDAKSGQLLQGSKDGAARTVVHLVRFEGTVQTLHVENFPYFENKMVDNWQITDIDDLLGSKKWYHEVFLPK